MSNLPLFEFVESAVLQLIQCPTSAWVKDEKDVVWGKFKVCLWKRNLLGKKEVEEKH